MNKPFEPGLLFRMPGEPRRVALVRASRIGDYLCAVPALRSLRAALPNSEVTLIALPFVGEMAQRSPYVDRFVPFPGFPGIAEQFFDARRAGRFFEQMQAERFDLAVQMHGSGAHSNTFALMLGARCTAGYVREGDTPGRLDAALPYRKMGHEIERALALARFLGAPDLGTRLEFPLFPGDHAEAERLLEGIPRPLIGVHPAAREVGKRWPPERFAQAAAELQRRYGGTIVIICSDEEREAAEQVARASGPSTLNLAGKTSLATLGAVIARLGVLITNDSGPAHIAYALGTSSVTLFGTTDPARWGPLDPEPHRVVAHQEACPPSDDTADMTGCDRILRIGVEEVVAAAEQVMETNGVPHYDLYTDWSLIDASTQL